MCAYVPHISTRTRLVLVTHYREDRKPTNTGRLATECLCNSEIWVRGHAHQPSDHFVIDPQTVPLVLFPSEASIPLTDFIEAAQPITLIVPDGTWRQASKVPHRVPSLARVPLVSLPDAGPVTQYRLRHETREGGLATMEAIARALGLLEGPDVQAALERVFRIMVERTLWSRGELPADCVTNGIPAGAQRHDPLSGTPHFTTYPEVAS